MQLLQTFSFVFVVLALSRADEFDVEIDCDPSMNSGCDNKEEEVATPSSESLSPIFDLGRETSPRHQRNNIPHLSIDDDRTSDDSTTIPPGKRSINLPSDEPTSIPPGKPSINLPSDEPTSRRGHRGPKRGKGKKKERNRGKKSKKPKKTKKVPTGTTGMTRPTNASFEETVSTSEPNCPSSCALLPCPKTDLNNCRGGLVYGYCNCCKQCAKVEGEECGGTHLHFGKCDRGLKCNVETLWPTDERIVTTRNTPEDSKGVCTKVAPPKPKRCKPECTPAFCTGRRGLKKRTICSARSRSIEHRSCQGNCQHTTCRSCFFQKAPDCREKCDLDDFKCMKKFSKCAKKKIYSKPKKIRGRVKTEGNNGQFVCWVPECKTIG